MLSMLRSSSSSSSSSSRYYYSLDCIVMNECVEQAAVSPKEEEGKSAILFRVCKKP